MCWRRLARKSRYGCWRYAGFGCGRNVDVVGRSSRAYREGTAATCTAMLLSFGQSRDLRTLFNRPESRLPRVRIDIDKRCRHREAYTNGSGSLDKITRREKVKWLLAISCLLLATICGGAARLRVYACGNESESEWRFAVKPSEMVDVTFYTSEYLQRFLFAKSCRHS